MNLIQTIMHEVVSMSIVLLQSAVKNYKRFVRGVFFSFVLKGGSVKKAFCIVGEGHIEQVEEQQHLPW